MRDSRTRYFLPRFVKIVVNESVTWYNTDNESHSLILVKEIKPYDIAIGNVEPGTSFSKKFDFYVPKIDYSCAIHPEEKGTIVIYPKSEEEMTNTETLRHLSGFLGRDPPDILKHLGHKPITYGITVLPEIQDDITFERFLDPLIYKNLVNPDLYQLQSQDMTIVFWDISHFSDLCRILVKQPVMIAGFLIEYQNAAIKIIHDHEGVLDKFIGDGIMAFFGFNKSDDQTKSASDAINAALELRQNFNTIKKRWTEIWSKNFGHQI
jgi:hypothetical protein